MTRLAHQIAGEKFMIKQVILAALIASSGLAGAPAFAADALLPVSTGQEHGKITLTLPAPGPDGISARFLYVVQAETGIGAATTSVDRGAPLREGIIRFRRAGAKVIAELENTTYVAPGGSAAQQASVASSFPTATLWVGDITETQKAGSFAFDFAPFLTKDYFGFAQRLGEGYKLDADRSVADPTRVEAFPDNVEFSALLSFASGKPTPELRNISPTGSDISLWVRHSLVRLPIDPMPIRHDPYNFIISLPQYDFSAPLGQAMLAKVATRHRLEKVDKNAARSPVKEPIVYYIDGAAPEPVRQALVDGVSWWAEAFAEAGYQDAFRVAILPADADPLDIRYNVVNWINRATRGWSYGSSIVDPRTGEILKGSVMLGSLRVRQDILIFQALVGAGLTNTGNPNDPVPIALARIRQLGAHEVGHTLGFQHNFAASTQGRHSVMDYPAPRVRLLDGKIDLTDAYGVGVGEWDKFLVRYLYAADDEAGRALVQEAQAKGLRFASDNDSRPMETANPQGALWDDGEDAVVELSRVMAVRSAALAQFDVNSVPAGQDLASLRRAFVPIWLLHRYQVEAAAKTLGGVVTPSALAGDVARVTTVPGMQQTAALDALIGALSIDALTVPARLQPLLSFGPGVDDDYQSAIEIMPTAGGPVFDSLRATEIGAVQVLDNLLDPQRLNRLEMQHAVDHTVPSVDAVAARLLDHADKSAAGSAVGRRIATTIVMSLARTAGNGSLSRSIGLQINGRVAHWAKSLGRSAALNDEGNWRRGLAALISDREALAAALADRAMLPAVPPGMPIG